MTTTPEQLQAFRDIASAEYLNDDNIRVKDIAEEHYIAGYLRAKQETEQAIKDARKQALEEAANILSCVHGSSDYRRYAAKIKELLND